MVAWNVRGVGYGSTTFPHAARLARGPASPGVGVGPAGLDAARRRRGLGRDPRGGQPVAEAGPGGGPGGAAAPARPRRAAEAHGRAAGPGAGAAGVGPGGVRLPRRRVDGAPHRGRDRDALRGAVPPGARQPADARAGLEPPAAAAAGDPARRGGHRALVRRALAAAQKRAAAEGRTIVWVDESGFYLLPGCVRTYAPRGRTPVLRV